MMWSGLIVYQPGPVRRAEPPGPDLPPFPKPCLVKMSFSILETKLLALGPQGTSYIPTALHVSSLVNCFVTCCCPVSQSPSLGVTGQEVSPP